jgi:hypothetical protein
LLDWLASEFRDGEQSLKQLHRLICNSATYRQAVVHNERQAEIDGDNRYYWRGNRRRLEAEAIRDAALAISGRLDARMYGAGFWCFVLEKPQHSPHYEYQKFDPNDPAAQRRSIYRFIVRSAPDPFLEVLDCADPSQLVDKRNETITPRSALGLLNNEYMTVMAGHFAQRLASETDDPAERIELAFVLALSRLPTDQERQLLLNYASTHGLPNACRLLMNMNEFVFVD